MSQFAEGLHFSAFHWLSVFALVMQAMCSSSRYLEGGEMELKFSEPTPTILAIMSYVALIHRMQPMSGGLPMEVALASQTVASVQPILSMVRILCTATKAHRATFCIECRRFTLDSFSESSLTPMYVAPHLVIIFCQRCSMNLSKLIILYAHNVGVVERGRSGKADSRSR